jgi:hypothetical protein
MNFLNDIGNSFQFAVRFIAVVVLSVIVSSITGWSFLLVLLGLVVLCFGYINAKRY